jgi:ABC-type transport system substrate-binding protein
MAVDRETISATYFRGHGRPAPFGLMLQSQTGWAWPYEEWPEEVKREYEYRPADAEALLDEAGYPRGDDGIRFHVKLALHDRFEPTHPELIMGYFEAIGVTGELVMQTVAESGARNRAEMAEWELLSGGYGFPAGQDRIKSMCQNVDDFSYTKTQCTRLKELHEAAMGSIELEDVQSIIREADEITVREHFGLVKSISPRFSVNQPWVKSFSGESSMGLGERNTFFARLWIDSELKEASTGN